MSQEIKNTVYCTIFDANYLARALALYESLMRVNEAARFAFFCMDAKSAGLLTALKLERSIIVTHEEFATAELLGLKVGRSQGEYCWTCKPFALLYLMQNSPQVDWAVYVDTDMMFFSDPDEAISDANVHYLLTPHRFTAAFSASEKSAGKHNAGYVAARNSSQGKRAIVWWRDRCIESCSYIPTDTTFADQKYLDQFAKLFPDGASSTHKGLNTAPWNVSNFTICNGAKGIYVDEVPLLLYHFQGLQLFDNGTASLYIGDMRISDTLREIVYQPHLVALLRAFARLRAIDPGFSRGLGKPRKYLGNIARRVLKVITNRANVVPFDVV